MLACSLAEPGGGADGGLEAQIGVVIRGSIDFQNLHRHYWGRWVAGSEPTTYEFIGFFLKSLGLANSC